VDRVLRRPTDRLTSPAPLAASGALLLEVPVADLTTLRKQSGKKARKQARKANKTLAPYAADARVSAVRAAETTREWAGPKVGATRDWAAPKVEVSRDWAAPKVEAARDWAAPKVEAARDWAAPQVETAVSRVKEDVLPKVAGAVAAALAASEPAREEAAKRSTAAVAALKGDLEPPKKSHKLRNLFLLAGVIGAAVAGWRAWTKQGQADELEPWVAASPPPSSPVASSPVPAPAPLATDDPAGASPDEALADAADEPIEATTEPVSSEQAAKVDEAAKPYGS
jgi:hypothetical protein